MKLLKTLETILFFGISPLCSLADFPVQPVCTASGNQKNARVSENKVVWEDSRNGMSMPAIFGKIIGDAEIKISSDSYTNNYNPDIENDEVMWARSKGWTWNAGFSARKWNGIQENLPFATAYTSGPKMSGRKFAWGEGGDFFDPNYINVYDRNTGQIIFSQKCSPGNQSSPAMFGDLVVFENYIIENYIFDYGLYLLNLINGEKITIDTCENMTYPSIGEKYVTYQKEINGQLQIIRYNPATGEKKQITFQGNNKYSSSFKGSIVYGTDRFGDSTIMIYDDINGERIVARNGSMPDLSRDYVVFQRGDYPNYDIFAAENRPGFDVNQDCAVNILDLIYVRNKIGQDVNTGDNFKADVNLDSKINILDLIAVRNALGRRCD